MTENDLLAAPGHNDRVRSGDSDRFARAQRFDLRRPNFLAAARQAVDATRPSQNQKVIFDLSRPRERERRGLSVDANPSAFAFAFTFTFTFTWTLTFTFTFTLRGG